MSKPRIGYRMAELADIVSSAPGISKAAALRAAGLADRGIGYLRPITRTIEAGLIIETGGNPCHLFASEADRELFNLRAELLGHPDAERAEQLVAEIDRLRRVQADEYRTANTETGQ